MFSSLIVRRFRGIPHLKLDDLGRINILVGRNATGKTTVLEAAALAAQPDNPRVLNQIADFREMPAITQLTDQALQACFVNMDIDTPIELVSVTETGKHVLTIRAASTAEVAERMDVSEAPSEQISSVSSLAPNGLRGVTFRYQPPKGKAIERTLRPDAHGLYLEGAPAPGPRQPGGAFFLSARRATSSRETAAAVTELYAAKREQPFLEALQTIEPRVARLQPGLYRNSPVVLVDVGLDRMLPMNVLGDGFCRLCLIATGLVISGPHLVLVDEIDSGLHHSVMESFWGALLRLAEHSDCQIISTTHHEEMLRYALAAFEHSPDALRVFRLDRAADGTVTAQKYTYDMLKDAEAAGFEIR